MFKLNNKSKKVMKALSLGIVSLGLLAGIGMSSNSFNNVHADEDSAFINQWAKETPKEDAQTEANEIKTGVQQDAQDPSLAAYSASYDPSNFEAHKNEILPHYNKAQMKEFISEFSNDAPEGWTIDTKGNIHTQNQKNKHHTRRHDKNLARNKKAKRASRRTRRAKRYSYKKAKPIKRSRAKVVKEPSHHSWRHVRSSKNHLSKLNKNHKKSIKRTHKVQRLTKKQVNHFNNLIKKDKRALKSKRAKHNYKYRKSLSKSIKSIQRFLNAKK